MASELVHALRSAAVAFNEGDVEPLVQLLDPEVDWIGVPRGFLWWKRAPS